MPRTREFTQINISKDLNTKKLIDRMVRLSERATGRRAIQYELIHQAIEREVKRLERLEARRNDT